MTSPNLPAAALRAFGFAAVGVLSWCAQATKTEAQSNDRPLHPEAKQNTEALIQQLGHPSFRQREQAAHQLEQLGRHAFLPLMQHDHAGDREIRERVRYLLDRLRPEMIRDGVPVVDRCYVADYLGLMNDDRRERILVLSEKLAPAFCIEALVRLAQIEEHTQLSKLAATGVLRQGTSETLNLEKLRAQLDRTTAGSSGKPATKWLQVYRRLLDNPQSAIADLEQVVAEEQQLLREKSEDTDETLIVLPLQWLLAETQWRVGRKDRSLAALGEMLTTPGDGEQNLKLLAWLRAQGRRDIVARLADEHAAWFEAHPRARYLVAACLVDDGEQAAGEALSKAISDTVDEPQVRYEHARWLREQVLSDWSIREYVATIASTEVESFEHIAARLDLSFIYHYQDRNLEAAEQLQKLVDVFESSPTALGQVETVTSLDVVASNMHYYLAKHYGQAGDTERQIDHYRQALDEWDLHSDAIINAYLIADAPAEWKEEIRERVDGSVDSLRVEFARYRAMAEQVTDYSSLRELDMLMGRSLNELAWILAHTESDPNTALQIAQLSIRLDPTRGYALDTLATCYYFAQDYEKAAALERQSLLLLPNREDVQRTLAKFEAALVQQNR